MAAIRIRFPGREQTSVIPLEHTHITIGRSPANTIQIPDHTVSSRHAELIKEGECYHLYDKGSTNGVFVNGQQVTDYHLREPCHLAFGTYECEFLKEPFANEDTQTSGLPSRTKASTTMVSRAEYEAVVVQRDTLVTRFGDRKRELVELRTKLSSLHSERAKYATALTTLRAEHSELKKAHECLEAEAVQLRTELNSSRAQASELQSRVKEQAIELTELRKKQEQLIESAALHVSLEKYEQLAAEHASTKDAQRTLNTQVTRLQKELATLTSVKDELQRTIDAQRRKLEAAPQAAEVESLRMTNEHLECRVRMLTGEVESLHEANAVLQAEAALSVPRDEYERLEEEHQRCATELNQARQQLTDALAERENADRELEARDRKIEMLQRRLETESWKPHQALPSPETHALLPEHGEEHPSEPVPPGIPIEQALEELGFVVRPIRRSLVAKPKGEAAGQGALGTAV